MTTINVHVSRSQLQKFQRWAKENYPREIMSAMWGQRENGSYVIEYITPYHVGDNYQVVIEADEWKILEKFRKEGKYAYLGTIHTHPQEMGRPKPSTHDIHAAAHDKEPVWAVCNVWKEDGKFRTDTQFYTSGPVINVRRV